VLAKLHGGPSGGHLGVNKTLNKVRQRYYWLQARNYDEKWCWWCHTCAASRGPQTSYRSHVHQYNIGALFERIAIDEADSSHGATKEINTSWSLWIILWSGQKPTPFPIKRLWQRWQRWLATSSAVSEYQGRYIVPQAVTLNLIYIGGFAMPGSKQDVHHALAPAVGWHGGVLHQNGRGALMEGCHIAQEWLGCKITHLAPGLQGMHSWHYGLDPS
jgi:hypothetical protein